MAQRRAGEKADLTREGVLDAALALADAEGLDALTMRGLGRRLGVEAMSVYHYFSSKRALVDALVDRVWSEVTLDPHDDWRVAGRRTARSAFGVLLHHPWVNRIRASSGGPARIAYIEASLGHLRRAAFTPQQAFHAHHVLEAYIQGYVFQAIEFASDDAEAERAQRDSALEAFRDADVPYLVEHIVLHGEHQGSGFDVGLELLLDGLEKRKGATAVDGTRRDLSARGSTMGP